MIRCCLCRNPADFTRADFGIEPAKIPGTGWRCIDRTACRARVRDIVRAHQQLGEVCQ